MSESQPAKEPLWMALMNLARDWKRCFPSVFFGMQKPTKFQHFRMLSPRAVDLVQFLVRFRAVAQQHPTFGRFHVKLLTDWQRFDLHGCPCTGFRLFPRFL